MSRPETGPGPEEGEPSAADKLYGEEVELNQELIFKKVAQRTLEEEGGSAEEQAKIQAQRGQPRATVNYLELSQLSPEEKREILAQAYEAVSKNQDKIAEIDGPADLKDLWHRDAELSRQKAAILRGKGNI